MSNEPKREPLSCWAICELLGHVRMAGRLTEEELFGTVLGRLDVPSGPGPDDYSTHYFGGNSVYRITPVSEEVARGLAAACRPAPVKPWELPAPRDDDDEPEEFAIRDEFGRERDDDEDAPL